MFDANKLLNQMLGAGSQNQAAKGTTAPLGLGGLFGSLLSDSPGKAGVTADKARGAPGGSANELFDKVKACAGQNRVATGAALGGLGALLLGTRNGRGILGGGAALGGLAMIGGLAFKAFQNHQASAKPTVQKLIEPAPAESPFGET